MPIITHIVTNSKNPNILATHTFLKTRNRAKKPHLLTTIKTSSKHITLLIHSLIYSFIHSPILIKKSSKMPSLIHLLLPCHKEGSCLSHCCTWLYTISLSLSTALSFPLLLVIIIMRPLYKFYYFTIEGYDVFIIIEFISRIDLLIEKEIHWLSKYVLIYLLLALFSITTVEVQIFHSCHMPQSYLITFIYSPKNTKISPHKLF